MPVPRISGNAEDMKKIGKGSPKVSGNTARVSSRTASPERDRSELRPHYDFDYSKSRPNRFAAKLADQGIAVVLDADVAMVFQSSEAVNAFLRSAISAMPQRRPARKRRAS
jgi:hypothetical protein